MWEEVQISQEIKRRLDAYCSESGRPFEAVLQEAIGFFLNERGPKEAQAGKTNFE